MARAKSATIPAPVGGWNARDPLDAMEEVYAIRMVNYFPQLSEIELRKGYRTHSTGLSPGPVTTLAEYAGQDGSRKLIAAANGQLYDASSFGGTATSLATGYSNNNWQTVNFKNVLILVNGTDIPQQYNGTTVSAATYTGISDPTKLIATHVYRSRLYFVESNTAKIWYGGVDSITGALTELNLSTYLSKGGYLLFAGSRSKESQTAGEDLFVVVSNMGEVLLFSGSYPGGADWTTVGRYYLPIPLGRRSFFNKDAEMALITEQGVIPLSHVLETRGSPSDRDTLTSNISNAFREAASNYGTNFGWQGLVYPRGNMIIINVPFITGSQSEQYVLNNLTGAWCRFTGINAICWGLFNQKPYFGGNDGNIYEFDVGQNDNGSAIQTKIKFPFNYFKDRAHIKRFLLARPLIRTESSLGFIFGVDTDFQDVSLTDTISTMGQEGSPWDTSPWDTSPWGDPVSFSQDWSQLSGLGRCGALRMEGDFLNVSFALSAVNMVYEQGGFL